MPKHRANIFVKRGIIVSGDANVCSNHFEGDDLSEVGYQKISPSSLSLNAMSDDIKKLLSDVRSIALQCSHTLNFNDGSAMTVEDYMRLTGITKTKFDQELEYIPSLRSTFIRSSRTDLALLLVKHRTGLSLAILSSIF